MFSDIFISESILYSSLNFSKKNTIILNLIKNTQEFNLQYKQISSQLHEKLKKNLSFVLHENEILRKMNCVYISHQEMIQNQLLELYHDCFNENYWDRNKILKLVQYYFTWNDITVADFTKLFFEHVECHFNFSRSIIMNKDSHIMSDFWQEICKIQMIKQYFFTAYHSQMND